MSANDLVDHFAPAPAIGAEHVHSSGARDGDAGSARRIWTADATRGRRSRARDGETDVERDALRADIDGFGDFAAMETVSASGHSDAGDGGIGGIAQNSSFESLSESLGGRPGDEAREPVVAVDGGLDDFVEYASEPAAVEQAGAPAAEAAHEPAVPASASASAPISNVGSMAALSESDFAAPEPMMSVEQPLLNTLNSPHLQAFRAKQARLIAEKEDVERREIERIKEEAVAELELMAQQRAKIIAAAKQSNRERQTAEEELFANSTGWEAVCNYVSEDNLVPNSLTDLSKMRSLLRLLKNAPPVKTA